ncbi:FHA domain-containing protein FHA2 isoform X2 [Sorghum bicolor]|uniref:FHA domain-containing protein n=1 Tax=Sorghum bicolor TaxID=4558 RepID=A0A1Z5RAN5_SORBI|nr:FHA domain-containing protein FHA2 isoform X2 [Sorghum bicolor]OQU80834.1 hypothetical protein SORBI_3007G195400 [Sorghum bicolor]|eukprot:XP_021321053.1 FHA domain-containing protein FHA2 isoform X2 [Sorghum bicolor]
MPGGSSGADGEVDAGFAKLQGEDFEYYMQTYSIMLGRNSKKSTVDVDLSSLGGGMNISRHHARIFYDFQRRRFALDVIGKNGCLVEGVLHLPGNPPVKLDSQDLLQIGDKKFYFLLPTRSIFASAAAARHAPVIPPQLPPPSYAHARGPGRPRLSEFHDRSYEADYGREVDEIGNGISETGMRGKLIKRIKKSSVDLDIYGGHRINVEPIGTLDSRSDIRSRGERDIDNQQALQAEEKDVVSSVATVLSDLCGPGEWMPMAKLHTELLDQFGNVWHPSRVRKYLTQDDWSPTETKGRPWFGLLALLRKYPEHFVINTRSKGRMTSEFVSLVSLLS